MKTEIICRDAYGQVGTPDWYDSEEEFYQS